MICEYLEEAYTEAPPLMPTEPDGDGAEVRRLVAWFDGKFGSDVSRNLLGEKFMKRLLGHGNPDAGALRAGYANLRHHLEYIGWLAETRRWLAGDELSLADFRGGESSVGVGFRVRRGLVDVGARRGTGMRG